MTATEFKSIRESAGLSMGELADKLRLASPRLLLRFEQGEQEVSGPISILMELIDRGVEF
jgi:transcriptional regulator with XRE-family HTH domain